MANNMVSCTSHSPCSLRQFFANSREAMYITSRAGEILDHNHAFEDLLGYAKDELKVMGIATILDQEVDRLKFQHVIERDGVVHDYPMALRHKTGLLLLCMVDAVVWTKDGKTAGYHGIIRTREAVMESFRQYFNKLKEEKRMLREARKNLVSDTLLLSRYITDEMLDVIQKTGTDPLQSGQVKATILFFDIRSSTAIAEQTKPEDFAQFLSEILSDIMDLVFGCHGSVNKLLGDGLMATFGCPVSTGNDAWNAVDCAKKIREYLGTFNDVRPQFLTQEVQAGIGIATGTIFAGVIGSVRRQEYAVLGDAVNIASRLEGLTKASGKSILIDDATHAEISEMATLKPVFKARIRGKDQAILVYSV